MADGFQAASSAASSVQRPPFNNVVRLFIKLIEFSKKVIWFNADSVKTETRWSLVSGFRQDIIDRALHNNAVPYC